MNKPSPSVSNLVLQAACVGLCIVGLGTAASAALTPFEAKLNQRKLEPVYTEMVEQAAPVKPWANSDVEVIGRLIYPRLKKSAVVLSLATEEALDNGPSLMPDTAAIGAPGTSVITAHRDTHFRFLKFARIGDIVQAAGADGVLRDYRVSRTDIVDARTFRVPMGISENRLVLYTCYPFESQRIGNKRFVVFAEPVS